jgi:hypothetical protein
MEAHLIQLMRAVRLQIESVDGSTFDPADQSGAAAD